MVISYLPTVAQRMKCNACISCTFICWLVTSSTWVEWVDNHSLSVELVWVDRVYIGEFVYFMLLLHILYTSAPHWWKYETEFFSVLHFLCLDILKLPCFKELSLPPFHMELPRHFSKQRQKLFIISCNF
jgi:hypothetical protein